MAFEAVQDEKDVELDSDVDFKDPPSRIETIQFTQQLIDEIRHATLDDGKLDEQVVQHL